MCFDVGLWRHVVHMALRYITSVFTNQRRHDPDDPAFRVLGAVGLVAEMAPSPMCSEFSSAWCVRRVDECAMAAEMNAGITHGSEFTGCPGTFFRCCGSC